MLASWSCPDKESFLLKGLSNLHVPSWLPNLELQTWQPLLFLTYETDSWLYLNQSACAVLIFTFCLSHVLPLLNGLPHLQGCSTPATAHFSLGTLLTICGLDFIYFLYRCTFTIFTTDWDSWGQKLSCFLVLLFLPEHLESATQEAFAVVGDWSVPWTCFLGSSTPHLITQ